MGTLVITGKMTSGEDAINTLQNNKGLRDGITISFNDKADYRTIPLRTTKANLNRTKKFIETLQITEGAPSMPVYNRKPKTKEINRDDR